MHDAQESPPLKKKVIQTRSPLGGRKRDSGGCSTGATSAARLWIQTMRKRVSTCAFYDFHFRSMYSLSYPDARSPHRSSRYASMAAPSHSTGSLRSHAKWRLTRRIPAHLQFSARYSYQLRPLNRCLTMSRRSQFSPPERRFRSSGSGYSPRSVPDVSRTLPNVVDRRVQTHQNSARFLHPILPNVSRHITDLYIPANSTGIFITAGCSRSAEGSAAEWLRPGFPYRRFTRGTCGRGVIGLHCRAPPCLYKFGAFLHVLPSLSGCHQAEQPSWQAFRVRRVKTTSANRRRTRHITRSSLRRTTHRTPSAC